MNNLGFQAYDEWRWLDCREYTQEPYTFSMESFVAIIRYCNRNNRKVQSVECMDYFTLFAHRTAEFNLAFLLGPCYTVRPGLSPMTGDSKPIISCVICTYRRPEMLYRAIKSIKSQTLSHDNFEVIIVDNNSGDQTSTVVDEFKKQVDFNLLYFLETKQGLSNARNTGIQHARGKYIAFLDDDAEAGPEWLSTFVRVFEEISDTWVVGGKILPIWDAKRPSWLSDDLLNNFSMLDLGDKVYSLKWPDHVLGTSCFHKNLFEEIGLFEPNLGRRGNSLVGDEDSEIQRRVHAVGKQVIYAPQAIVWHHISPDRLVKQYLYHRAYGTGQSRAFMICQQGNPKQILWQYCRALLALMVYLLSLLWTTWDERKRIRTIRSIFTKIGFLKLLGSCLVKKRPRD